MIDQISGGKLTTEYRYHQGYWDGDEREFRGFGMVEQFDTETIDRYQAKGLHGSQPFTAVDPTHFSPPTVTRTWFRTHYLFRAHNTPVDSTSTEEFRPRKRLLPTP